MTLIQLKNYPQPKSNQKSDVWSFWHISLELETTPTRPENHHNPHKTQTILNMNPITPKQTRTHNPSLSDPDPRKLKKNAKKTWEKRKL